jgi:hypothetical protein
MRRRALAGPILTAAVGLALAVSGCGAGSHHTTSTRVESPTSSSSGSGSASSTASSTTTGTGPATSSSTSAGSSPGPPPATGGRLTVAPADGHPSSTVRFTLVAPAASGHHGQTQLSYTLNVSGDQGSGCVAQHEAVVAVRRAGEPVTAAVGPVQLGGRWCPGSYAARVTELARPVCGPAQVCPQFIRVVAVIGPVRFQITP